MLNYLAFLVAAFFSLVFACLVAFYSAYLPIPILLFSVWCFRMMHQMSLEQPSTLNPLPQQMLNLLLRNRHKVTGKQNGISDAEEAMLEK